MNKFLRDAYAITQHCDYSQETTVVLGNETCDLDSAVSTLTYGLLLHEEYKYTKNDSCVIPLLNIQRWELPLKTEVVFWLERQNIPLDVLLFREDLDLQTLLTNQKLQLVLVDFHVLPSEMEHFKEAVIEVYDHRPQDENWLWPNIKVEIQQVGSCCTLIAREILSRNKCVLTRVVSDLLFGAIILDTVCLTPAAGRTTALDIEVIQEMECHFHFDKEATFQMLVHARRDVSKLSSSQILIKDMKIVCGVPVCGIPALIQDFIKGDDVQAALQNLCCKFQSSMIILMGIFIEGSSVSREIAVYSERKSSTAEKIMNSLMMCNTPELNLQLLHPKNIIHGLTIFRQGNIKATRKHIIPVLTTAIQSCKNECNV